MLVFNYTLNICSAVGIRVAPIRTSFRTPPPLLPVTGFRFLVISSLVYILSRRLSRSMYSFFFPPFRAFQSTLSPQGERPLFQITRRKLVYRSLGGLGPVVFLFFSSLFSFFDQETEDTVGFFGSLTRTFSRSCGTGLIMTGKRREGREREREGKGWSTDIRRFVSVSFIGKVRWELCDDIPSSTNMPSWWAIFHHVTELINISNNIVLLNDRIRFSM